MNKRKRVSFVLALLVTIAFITASVIGLFHSVWFEFTHIHLTRMEMIFDPENKTLLKLCLVVGALISSKVLTTISK